MAHRVVILGGGFGGLYAARALRKAPVEVTLIDRRNFHLFQPLLYQVATGSLSPGEICAPLRSILSKQKNTRVLLGEAVGLDARARKVTLRDGAVFEYDSLIAATGSESSYYGHDQWREWAPSLKSVEEATAIRHKILYAFEAAERVADPEERRAWLTFVIVGGGATGVELAGALGEIARHTLKHEFRSIDPKEARILILDGSPRVLTSYPEDLSARAEESLVRLGVRVRTGVRVVGVDAEGVSFQHVEGGPERLEAKTVLWAGGVQVSAFARILAEATGAQTDRGGRLKVNADLSLPGFPEIYVVGDLADAAGRDGKPLPGVAQVAMQGGAYAARSIAARAKGQRETKPFHYFDKGDLAVIGRAAAVARIFGLRLQGLIAWLVWVFVHILYLVEFESRVLVFIQWGFLYLTFSRGARLITGSAATDSLTPGPTLKNLSE
ncbi:MAG TPA: NAD(P)/FAD-dependent oxidoreductase [Bryobacteraceae bacterium]|nr:NAD(P)/FAD-dependent oxidoreductase [Bryobacteraceae bacterium]